MKIQIKFPVFIRAAILVAALALMPGRLVAQSPDQGLVAHEWGTFTSFQAADGVLLKWRTLAASGLPAFVVHYNQPGPGLYALGDPVLTPPKAEIYSLQRMETPVVYFYSHTNQTVDVRVNFPHGLITEWYPAASQYGPSHPAVTRDGSHSPDYIPGTDSATSMIRWNGLRILPVAESKDTGAWRIMGCGSSPIAPAAGSTDASAYFPQDKSGSHYFAARETDANPVVTGPGTLSAAPETEKFLFYRGVGNFATPLVVTMPSDDVLTVENKGKETLARVFVVGARDGVAGFADIGELKPGVRNAVPLNFWQPASAREQMEAQLSEAMKQALVAQGLYAREAEAMVKTWKDSWFGEEGVRVLYLLLRQWTDQTLPMQLNPVPRELVRVMVGRAEVLAPATERSLAVLLPKVRDNDSGAAAEVGKILNRLGRFAEPAYQRVSAGMEIGKMDEATQARLRAPLDRVEEQIARR